MKNYSILVFFLMLLISCGNNDLVDKRFVIDEQGSASQDILFTAIIGANHSLNTRSVTDLGDGSLTVKWKEGEKLAIIIDDDIFEANVIEVKTTGDAVVNALLPSNISNGSLVKFVYPYSAADVTSANGVKDGLLEKQDGSLASISDKYDVAIASSTISVEGNNASTTQKVTLANQYAICKFSFTEEGKVIDGISQMTIISGDDSEDTYSIKCTQPSEVVYVSMKPTSKRMNFEIETISGSFKGTAKANLSAGFYYRPTLKMKRKSVIESITIADLGRIIGSDGQLYDKVSDVPESVTASGMIAYVGSDTYCKSFDGDETVYGVDVPNNCIHGLALSISDLGSSYMDSWANSKNAVANYTTERPEGVSEWMIPSVNQWKRMLVAFSGNDQQYVEPTHGVFHDQGTLREALKACEAIDFSLSEYWSSTECSRESYHPNAAWYVRMGYQWMYSNVGLRRAIRPCFAF